VNFYFSFCGCCIFCWTLSSSLSMVSSSSSSSFSCVYCSVGCSWMCAIFSTLAFIRASSFALHSWFVTFEGAGAREISLPSIWWCSSWSVSAGMFFFDLFYGGIVSCFSDRTRWAPMFGVSENTDKIPGHGRRARANVQVRSTDDAWGDKESPKYYSRFKSCESFCMFPRAPFYRETKGLLHSESTLESKGYS
jgi:hypothetical protein